MKEEQVQTALKQIDQAVSQLTGTRETHTILAQDIQLIRQCCVGYFVEKENGGTDKQPDSSESGDQDS